MTNFLSLGSPIRCLFGACGPSQVAWFVMPIVIDPIYRMVGARPASDFFQKFFKGLKLKLYSSAAIIRIAASVRVGAAVFRALIRRKLRRPLALPAFSVRCVGLADSLVSQTAATIGVAGSKVVPFNDAHGAALAETFPISLAIFSGDISDNGKSAEFLTCDIMESSHAAEPPMFSGYRLGLAGYANNPLSRLPLYHNHNQFGALNQ